MPNVVVTFSDVLFLQEKLRLFQAAEIVALKQCLALRDEFNQRMGCNNINNHNDPYSYRSKREASLRCQLLMLPIMTPERMTNSSTMMFTAVKILLTIADSLTPNARIPAKKYNNS